MKDRLFTALQYLLPHHLLSRLVGKLAESRRPCLKNWLIRRFIHRYRVDLTQAERQNPEHYENFNAFFTRALLPEARPITSETTAISCPADGAVSQLGDVTLGRIFQAKGHSFSLLELLGGNMDDASPFMGGKFATIYLSPKDYHRVHMPLTGTLRRMTYIPGRLFSVNPLTAQRVPELFARNERVVCLFDTTHGPMAMVLVGAMIVAAIETVWAGQVAPPRRCLQNTDYDERACAPIHLEKGMEMGRFKLGSTVILLFGPDAVRWEETLKSQSPVVVGEKIAILENATQ